MTQKQYIGIREHAGTDFIVSPGRPDIWRKYIAGYEIIKFSISFHQENRIFDAKRKFSNSISSRKTGYLTQKEVCINRVLLGGVCINCVRISLCGFLAKLFGPEF